MTYVAEDYVEPRTPKQLVTGYYQQQHHPVDDEEREYSDRVTLLKRERITELSSSVVERFPH